MKLYFENWVQVATTAMLIGFVGFTLYSFMHRDSIELWGRRTLFLSVYGLLICCFAAARDGLDRTIQYSIDKSCEPGIFELISVPNMVGCVGAAIIIIAGLASVFCHKQSAREVLFFVMSGGALLKIAAVEIARILLLF
ncbi:MAG: hypothetical protein ACOX1S_07610 [Anaerostipes sp.]|jgi:hypothetical protein|nr:hypothetical protein [Anaerostipes sp.]